MNLVCFLHIFDDILLNILMFIVILICSKFNTGNIATWLLKMKYILSILKIIEPIVGMGLDSILDYEFRIKTIIMRFIISIIVHFWALCLLNFMCSGFSSNWIPARMNLMCTSQFMHALKCYFCIVWLHHLWQTALINLD